ncbi:extracellular solute-binding protein [Acuticoccus sediminis]|uniref:extracellular solute-binding protein n=1 Tax=Acuticoccus sediminis TaxID=2184697 RepID=UPI001CFE4FB7|nr:extracellular solute-binding protein [Acuticoccus sediminis]
MSGGVRLTRRRVLELAGAATALSATPWRIPRAAAAERRHALAVFGEARHPPGFAHFDYVNPDAPRGGELRLVPSSAAGNQNLQTFNTFNMFILRGDSPPLMELTHSGLMVRGLDEPDAVYGHIAEAVEIDGQRYAFVLRDGLTFSDGSPITSADVVYSFEVIRKHGHPAYAQPLTDNIASLEAPDPLTAVVTFKDGASNRMPPLIATYPVLCKAYYEANDFTAAKLDVPVTSGAYTVGEYGPGRYVNFERRKDYWGDALATGIGHNNFNRIRIDLYRERTLAFEAFKTGKENFREEFTSKVWATEYTFPAITRGDVIRRDFPDNRPAGAQGWFINTRREKFADKRVREALGWAFDFEWENQHLFYGAYTRTQSYFMNSDLMAEGEPSAAELALLEPFRDQVDPAVFGPAWTAPVSDGSGRDRNNLRRASDLLAEAGWERRNGQLVNAKGEPLVVEYLYPSEPTSERIWLPFANTLRTIGVEPRAVPVDATQYQLRIVNFDFDLMTQRFAFGPTPNDSIRQFFASSAANVSGSYNLPGIADPVVDAMLDAMMTAGTREGMVAAARVMDRVLRVGHYWIPQWYKAVHSVAYWDEFGIPEKKPHYEFPVETTWWSRNA